MHVTFLTLIAGITLVLHLQIIPVLAYSIVLLLGCFYVSPPWVLRILLGMSVALLLGGDALYKKESMQLSHDDWQKKIGITVDIESLIRDDSHVQTVLASVVIRPHDPFPLRIKLSQYDLKHRLLPGERCQLQVKMKPIRGYSNPGGRDTSLVWLARRVTAQGYVVNRAPMHCKQHAKWRQGVYHYRQALRKTIEREIPSSDIQSIIKALAIGEKSLSDEVQGILQKTGTAHLLAISGLHVGLVALLVFWLIQPLAKCAVLWGLVRSTRSVGMLLTLLAVAAYIVLTGSAVSSQRAGWMYAIGAVILCMKRMPQKLNILLGVMCLMMLLNPFVVFDIGFWLSCSMVFVVVVLCGYSVQQQRGLKGIVLTQWQLSWVTLPVTLLLLKQGSLISPLANLIAIPVVSFGVVPLLLIFDVMHGYFPSVAEGCLQIADCLVRYLWWFLGLWENTPVLWEIPLTNLWVHTSLIIAGVLLLFPRRLLAKSLGVYFLMVACLHQSPKPGWGEVWVDWVDVGQGLSVVVRTAEHTLVYDTGPRYLDFSVASVTLIPLLKHLGVKVIDQLVISHADNDHRGGIFQLLDLFHVKEMRVGQQLADIAMHQTSCQQDATWRWDGVSFEQWRVPGVWVSPNNHSCVLRVRVAKGSVLLLGDLEKDAEHALLSRGLSLQSTVLSVPHHGSKTSSTDALLKAVSPEVAIISSGFLNSYHHPHPSVVYRYDAFDVKQLDTAQVGHIRVTLKDEDTIEITCHRDKKC